MVRVLHWMRMGGQVGLVGQLVGLEAGLDIVGLRWVGMGWVGRLGWMCFVGMMMGRIDGMVWCVRGRGGRCYMLRNAFANEETVSERCAVVLTVAPANSTSKKTTQQQCSF